MIATAAQPVHTAQKVPASLLLANQECTVQRDLSTSKRALPDTTATHRQSIRKQSALKTTTAQEVQAPLSFVQGDIFARRVALCLNSVMLETISLRGMQVSSMPALHARQDLTQLCWMTSASIAKPATSAMAKPVKPAQRASASIVVRFALKDTIAPQAQKKGPLARLGLTTLPSGLLLSPSAFSAQVTLSMIGPAKWAVGLVARMPLRVKVHPPVTALVNLEHSRWPIPHAGARAVMTTLTRSPYRAEGRRAVHRTATRWSLIGAMALTRQGLQLAHAST
jgi:hypothetical protein